MVKLLEIRTTLHEGICKSSGGGQTKTYYRFAPGPRNFFLCAETYYGHVQSMAHSYGNIGRGYTGIFWGERDITRWLLDEHRSSQADQRRTIHIADMAAWIASCLAADREFDRDMAEERRGYDHGVEGKPRESENYYYDRGYTDGARLRAFEDEQEPGGPSM